MLNTYRYTKSTSKIQTNIDKLQSNYNKNIQISASILCCKCPSDELLNSVSFQGLHPLWHEKHRFPGFLKATIETSKL